MNEPKVKFIIKDFRAVANADIALDGISVLTGENSCGKSTISKLVYYALQGIINIEDEIMYYFYDRSRQLKSTVEKLQTEFPKLFGSKSPVSSYPSKKIDFKDLKEYLENDTLTQNTGRLNSILNQTLLPELYSYDAHLNKILNLENKDLGLELAKDKLSIFLEEVIERIYKKEEKIYESKLATHFIINGLNKKLGQNGDNINFNLFEFGSEIVNKKENKILPFHSFEKALYYDTPFVLGQYNTDELEYLDLLNQSISIKIHTNRNVAPTHLFDEVKKNVFKGTVENEPKELDNKYFDNSILDDLGVKPLEDNFIYKRLDGKKINLLESATGLKSFAILALLHQNGRLNNKTLLIIDEPEAHLHPQWIVEYARLVVLLHKELGVKFLISSHNPDMISAIKYIAEKEKIAEKLNFYLAEKAAEEFKYNFVNLHTNIEPIFSSFNIALDRIDEYGAVE